MPGGRHSGTKIESFQKNENTNALLNAALAACTSHENSFWNIPEIPNTITCRSWLLQVPYGNRLNRQHERRNAVPRSGCAALAATTNHLHWKKFSLCIRLLLNMILHDNLANPSPRTANLKCWHRGFFFFWSGLDAGENFFSVSFLNPYAGALYDWHLPNWEGGLCTL